MSILSKNLRFLREKRGLTLDQLNQLSIKKGTLSNYELGKTEPKIETLIDLSNFFGVSINDLLTIDLEKNSKENGKVYGKDNEQSADFNTDLTVQLLSEQLKSQSKLLESQAKQIESLLAQIAEYSQMLVYKENTPPKSAKRDTQLRQEST